MMVPTSGRYFAMLVNGERRIVQSRGWSVPKQAVILGRGDMVSIDDVLPLTGDEAAALGVPALEWES